MTSGSLHGTQLAEMGDDRDERAAQRVAELFDKDPQFRAAAPLPEVVEAACTPGLRLVEVFETIVAGYADRPALGQRTREMVTDADGRTSAQLRPRFETISYRDVWDRVRAIASAWRHDPENPVTPGDVVATVGFSSADYLVVDMVCAYLGLVTVPLQHNAPVTGLRPIIEECEPKIVAVSAEYLDLAVESVLTSSSLRQLMVFDYHPEVDEQRENFEQSRIRLQGRGAQVVVTTVDDVVERGQQRSAGPAFTEGSDERLAMIMYTSGSTGTPKGAMYTERTIARVWTSGFFLNPGMPVLNVNFMPLNHLGGRLPVASAFIAGGTNYFVPESDLSTLFEDWGLVRPTELGVVPRVVEMLYQHYRGAIDRGIAEGADPATAEQDAATEVREHVLGGRVLGGFVGSAPLAAEMKTFLDWTLGAHIVDGYGLTETGILARDGVISRKRVIDYKLVDVPELGYFLTDRPYPRGELLVKTDTMTPGYYKRPDITAQVFDEDGFYKTGDVMAEIEADHLVYVDRRNNVLKLAQGEFVAVTNLESIYAGAPLVQQIFVYGNSERPSLLAVIVPTPEALAEYGNSPALKAAIHQSLQQSAAAAQLQSYEVPVDFILETKPFTDENGLLSGLGKQLRPRLKERYGERLEELYTEIAAAQVDEIRVLRETAADRPVIETLAGACRALLGTSAAGPEAHFTDLGGDSLSALTFSHLLEEIFRVEVPVSVITSPANSIGKIADYIETQRGTGIQRPTFSTVHGQDARGIAAADLTLDKFVGAQTLATATSLPHITGAPHTVLLSGANGWLGRFLTLEWLERLTKRGGKLVTIVRGSDAKEARTRLETAFDSGDPELLNRFRELSALHLEVLPGDIADQNLGLDPATWQRLADTVDLIVHPAALVNHVLPYDQLFGPNVVGTAELIRLAITTHIKPITYLSTIAVAMTVPQGQFQEDGDIRQVSPNRPLNDDYANGYANSKWAGEVLLREANDVCGLPVAVFRSDMILAHTRYRGQLNVPDMFTRLIFSLLVTGIAPHSFYEREGVGSRARAHYDGLPVDFIAEAITTIGSRVTEGYSSFDVMNPYDDGISLDVFVDWLIRAGNKIQRIADYDDWLARFQTALTGLPERQRQQSILPLLHAFRKPEKPLRGAAAPTAAFHTAVCAGEVGPDNDIPHISAELIDKYADNLRQLSLLG
ncbi:oxidoreductase [Mycobacterium montefiorense]|uniref:Carboxylic acid reductase n=2 Tax=Mycobacterium montefiorense TaxID=154654 RepID=A0AA37PJ36_9MYCO|nr:oxidoreductase [Mycobacterium montefiorense]GKU34563.1 oxidoreductase [Mycobacterium montefiorense]GKU39184.1 oxidoreductase [Mycobacterium montefiorense]GKU43609.1 oxidoreductase [Mycobacterium montefiorense]GKU49949.1 oxidoreductase [Mycobacterium montefiorense]